MEPGLTFKCNCRNPSIKYHNFIASAYVSLNLNICMYIYPASGVKTSVEINCLKGPMHHLSTAHAFLVLIMRQGQSEYCPSARLKY